MACWALGSGENEFRNKVCRRNQVIMFPSTKDQLASFRETPICISVSFLVRFDLTSPEFGIRFWPSTVRGAAVPEASINEYSDTGRNKSQVGTTKQARQKLVVDTVAESLEAND